MGTMTMMGEIGTYLTKIEINEVFGFVRHVTTKITSNDTVPSGVVLFVEFLFIVISSISHRCHSWLVG
jgi:hypothetical protein